MKCTFVFSATMYVIYVFAYILCQPYLNVLQQLLLAPADVLQLLLLLWGEVVRHWKNTRGKMRSWARGV